MPLLARARIILIAHGIHRSCLPCNCGDGGRGRRPRRSRAEIEAAERETRAEQDRQYANDAQYIGVPCGTCDGEKKDPATGRRCRDCSGTGKFIRGRARRDMLRRIAAHERRLERRVEQDAQAEARRLADEERRQVREMAQPYNPRGSRAALKNITNFNEIYVPEHYCGRRNMICPYPASRVRHETKRATATPSTPSP